MGLLGIGIGILLICILCIIKGYYFCKDWCDSDDLIVYGVIGIVFDSVFLLAMASILLFKPYEYKNFKIEYETVKETITQKDDVRDATYTMQIIEINQKIRHCREFKDSKWIGIFQNEKICEMELLEKEVS